MTAGHLLFALGMTGYILIATQLEERDLVAALGDQYRDYRRGAIHPFESKSDVDQHPAECVQSGQNRLPAQLRAHLGPHDIGREDSEVARNALLV